MEDELARLRARQHALWSRESSPSRESPPPALNNAACQERRHVGQLWVKVIQTVESQYSVSSPSSCTLFAVEASLLLLQRGLYLSTGMLDSILALAGGYKLDTHLDVDEVLLHVERYKVSMQLRDQGQVILSQKHRILDALCDKCSELQQAVAAVVVQPPETVAIAVIPDPNQRSNRYILFDSHARPIHEGIAFLEFAERRKLEQYLDQLFPQTDIEGGQLMEMELLSSVGYHIFSMNKAAIIPKACFKDLEMVQLKRDIATLQRELRNERAENARLRLAFEVDHTLRRVTHATEQTPVVIRDHYEVNQPLATGKQVQVLSGGAKIASSQPSRPHPHWSGPSLKTQAQQFQPKQDQTQQALKQHWRTPQQHQAYIPSSYRGKGASPHRKPVSQGRETSRVHSAQGSTYDSRSPKAGRGSRVVNRGQRGGSGGKSGDNQHSNFSPARKQEKVTAAISSKANSKEDDELAATLALVQQLQVEEEAAARDRAWALELQSTFRMFECAICMDEKSVEDVFIVDPCNHQYCRECMIGHINAEIGNQHFPIRCPGCPPKSASGGELRQQDLYLLLEHVDFERYLRSTLELHISQTPAILSCPQPDCQGAAEIVPPHTRFICPCCSFSTCVSCKIPWHADQTCDEYQEWREANAHADERTDDLIARMGYRKCPQCQNAVEKTEGCNHMTCRCGTHFCYICARECDRNNPYGHFNQNAACPLFDGQ